MNNTLQVLVNWGLGDLTVMPIESPSHTTWDIGGEYVLKQYRSVNDAGRSIRLSGLLRPESIPVSEYIPDKNGQLSSPDGLYCLMTKLPGMHTDFYEDPQAASALGYELARLHLALAKIEPEVSHHDVDLLAEWHEKYTSSVRGLLADSIIDEVDRRFQPVYRILPRQLIHRDVHPQHVLFKDGKLTGWLDFDIGQKNLRIFDLAYFLSGLFIGNLNSPERIKLWHMICRNLLAGYDKQNPLTQDEHDILPVLMIVIECLFVWFWNTRNNDEQRGVALAHAEWLYDEFLRKG
jgi:Ser/Thr protein kinase RdoA (MazF antagonist)